MNPQDVFSVGKNVYMCCTAQWLIQKSIQPWPNPRSDGSDSGGISPLHLYYSRDYRSTSHICIEQCNACRTIQHLSNKQYNTCRCRPIQHKSTPAEQYNTCRGAIAPFEQYSTWRAIQHLSGNTTPGEQHNLHNLNSLASHSMPAHVNVEWNGRMLRRITLCFSVLLSQ